MNHKAGDKKYVDYAGKTHSIINKYIGEIIEERFFLAILGACQYMYNEAFIRQQKEDFVIL
jgi:transposase